jgi:hypothetical protein
MPLHLVAIRVRTWGRIFLNIPSPLIGGIVTLIFRLKTVF